MAESGRNNTPNRQEAGQTTRTITATTERRTSDSTSRQRWKNKRTRTGRNKEASTTTPQAMKLCQLRRPRPAELVAVGGVGEINRKSTHYEKSTYNTILYFTTRYNKYIFARYAENAVISRIFPK